MKPGAITLAVIRSGPRSWARERFHASTAALAALYDPAPGRCAAIELMLITVPPGASLGRSASVTSTAVSTLASRLARHAAASPARPAGGAAPMSVFPPAQWT